MNHLLAQSLRGDEAHLAFAQLPEGTHAASLPNRATARDRGRRRGQVGDLGELRRHSGGRGWLAVGSEALLHGEGALDDDDVFHLLCRIYVNTGTLHTRTIKGRSKGRSNML